MNDYRFMLQGFSRVELEDLIDILEDQQQRRYCQRRQWMIDSAIEVLKQKR